MEDTKLKLYRTAFFWGLPTFFECTSVSRGVPFMLKRELRPLDFSVLWILRTLDSPYSGNSYSVVKELDSGATSYESLRH